MPSDAFARPLWPATLRALRELTRLALASLVLAVGLGGAVAAAPPDRSAAGPPSVVTTVTVGAPATTVALGSRATPLAVGSPATPVAVRPAVEPGRSVDTGQDRRQVAIAPVRPERGAPTGVAPADRLVVPVPALREGEPSRRGPPTG